MSVTGTQFLRVPRAALTGALVRNPAARGKVSPSKKPSSWLFAVELQVGLKVSPVGVAQAGAWNYAFVYEILQRHYPGLPEQACLLSAVKPKVQFGRKPKLPRCVLTLQV